jgi:cytochrome b subunit of formate dehydrogenase
MRHVCSFCTVWLLLLLLFVGGGLLFFLLSLSLSLIPLHRCTVVTHTTTSLCLVFLLLVSVV